MRKIKELEGIPVDSREYIKLYQRLRQHGTTEKVRKKMEPHTLDFYKHNIERKYGVGSYQRLVDLLNNNCNSYGSIGKEFGVSRERIRQWRNRFLLEQGWERNGHRRITYCAISKKANGPHHPRLQFIIEKLAEIGLVGKPVIARSGKTLRKRFNIISVNGYRCKIYHIPNPHDFGNGQLYYEFFRTKSMRGVREKDYDFGIFICGEHIFIAPWKLLKSEFPNKSIYIPQSFENFGYKNHYPKIDWRQYRDAWHLLRREN